MGTSTLPDLPLLAGTGPNDGSKRLANPKHERFANEYLKDLNGGRAYQRAGYRAKPDTATNCASRLMADVRIQARVSYLRDRALVQAGLTQDEVLRVTKSLVMAQVDHFEVTEDGELRAKPGSPEGVMQAVASLKQRRHRRVVKAAVPAAGEEPAEDAVEEEWWEVEFRLWNKPEMLRLASQHTKLIGVDSRPDGAGIAIKVMGPGGTAVEVMAVVGGGR
jgi:phage terminase small subunit